MTYFKVRRLVLTKKSDTEVRIQAVNHVSSLYVSNFYCDMFRLMHTKPPWDREGTEETLSYRTLYVILLSACLQLRSRLTISQKSTFLSRNANIICIFSDNCINALLTSHYFCVYNSTNLWFGLIYFYDMVSWNLKRTQELCKTI